MLERLRPDSQIADNARSTGELEPMAFSNSMQQEALRFASRGRCMGAKSIQREPRFGVPFAFKGVVFQVSSCGPLVLVVLSLMTFRISITVVNNGGLSNMCSLRLWVCSASYPA